uniref:protein TIC 21, chloroplastic-like n=1 Tax=Erigeron canadensis TaxID=72917 RepID=UPI001CB946B6|nr:protein TIC 21, chloroplastic-like [Erigeron canadensis]
MQTLLLPAGRTTIAPPSLTVAKPSFSHLNHPLLSTHKSLSFSTLYCRNNNNFQTYQIKNPNKHFISSATYSSYNNNSNLAQVSKRLESTSRYFKRLGGLGFWIQLVLTITSAVILSFSVVITGKISSPATFYATSGGIAAAFLSAFWSFGHIRLSDTLRKTANNPSKAPPRADVEKSLKNCITLNVLGMGAAILGMQATVGTLVAKALTSSANSYYRSGSNPVLALDVFLVQASTNIILSHFVGLALSLELLRSVTLPL